MSLQEHLESGATTVARAWALTRADGAVLGFTDHDRDLSFDGVVFRAGSGLSARALAEGTGLAVNNTEALGALSDAAITEADLLAGRYDGAALVIWQVNWRDTAERRVLFRGTLGEVARQGGAFRAELRGLTEALGRNAGRVFQAACPAVLGDRACGLDLSQPGYHAERAVDAVEAGRILRFAGLVGFDPRWFEAGRLEVLSGDAAGLVAAIKNDRIDGAERVVELWEALAAPLRPGDRVRLLAGCDKRFDTCRFKFANGHNFRGFPDIPGEDWLMAYPRAADNNDGGSLRR